MVFQLLSITGFVIWSFVSLLFALSLYIKRNDIADVAWGTGIFIVAITAYVSGPQTVELFLLTTLAGFWGLRLTTRIFLRNIKKSEDPRYKVWRDSWGSWFYIRSYFQVYILQGILMIVVGYPFVHAGIFGGVFEGHLLFTVGLLVWLIGYVFEVVGDYQLDSFLKDVTNKGRIMRTGLWKYSRHPNYFGEVTMWWGVFLMVVTMPFGYVAVISPLMITFLILKVSGIPMLEKQFEDNAEFQEYKRKTSAFFPLPTKK